MSTTASAHGPLGRIADAATAAHGWMGRMMGRASGLAASAVLLRAERRLQRELAGLNERLLDDIGMDPPGRLHGRGRAALPHELPLGPWPALSTPAGTDSKED